MTFNEIAQHFKTGNAKPVYLLHGEEPYFIDKLTDLAIEHVIPADFRDFNQSVYYARETDPLQILDAVNRLPMMAEKQLVVLREAQNWSHASKWEQLEKYLDKPAGSTVFVIAYKYKKFDKRTKIYKVFAKHGCIFDSVKPWDNKIPDWISQQVKARARKITDKAIALIHEFVGNDLGRIDMELEKLSIVIPKGSQINEQDVERHIGISKDYNAFELSNAVLAADLVKANKIINYFSHNSKAGPMVLVVSSLHNTYRDLFKAHFAKTSDPSKLQQIIGVAPFRAREIATHMAKHHPRKISRNFGILRRYDLMSKGVGNSGTEGTDLMRELVYQLLS